MSMTLLFLCALLRASAPEPGALAIVGGGSIPTELPARIVALTGKAAPRVLVIPFASELDAAGTKAAEMFRAVTKGAVDVLDLSDLERAKTAVAEADVLWLGGGAQTRLVERLGEAGLIAAIRERHRAGVVVGGTSAGAAAMAQEMMTGKAELEAVNSAATVLAPGLGLCPDLLIDQHFHRRGRFNRLLSAVLDHPGHVGIGIDEGTAVLLCGRRIEVIGKSSVLILDARRAVVAPATAGAPQGATGVTLHLLASGATLDLESKTAK